jgi:hypothetical protein
MAVKTAAGTKVYIGPKGSYDDLTDYEAITTWVEIGEVESLGDFGDTVGAATFTALGNRRVRKFKTTYDAGTMSLTVGDDESDAGQEDLLDALNDSSNSGGDYAFRVVYDDQITAVTGNGTTLYFSAKVMSGTRNVGDVENIIRRTYDVAINSEIITDPAT